MLCYMCDVCGHIWLPESEATPERCASNKCRSRKWNAGSSASSTTPAKAKRRPSAEEEMSNWKLADVEALAAKTLPAAARPAPQAAPTIHTGSYSRPEHDPDTCRLYNCGMCKAAKAH